MVPNCASDATSNNSSDDHAQSPPDDAANTVAEPRSDAISDAVLDACLERDPNARVACETLCSTNILVLAGEIGLAAGVEAPDYEAIARETAVRIGYDDADKGLDGRSCEVHAV